VVELITLLAHTKGYVRTSAAWVLGKIRAPRAIIELTGLLNDADAGVRSSAAEALGEICAPEAVPGLIELLDDKISLVRRNAAEALGKIRAPEAVPKLIILLKDEEEGVQANAARALGEIGSREALPELVNLFQYWSLETRPKSLVAETLSQKLMRFWHGNHKPSEEVVLKTYPSGDFVTETGWSSKLMAISVILPDVAKALGRLRDEKAIPELKRFLHHAHPYIYEKAIISGASALWDINAKEARSETLNLLHSRPIQVREKAAEMLGENRVVEAVPHLGELLGDRYVRDTAAKALGRIGDESAIKVLCDAILRDPISAHWESLHTACKNANLRIYLRERKFKVEDCR